MTDSPDTAVPRNMLLQTRPASHAARIDAAIARERRRIARELHDMLGAAHTAMRLEVVALIATPPACHEELLVRLERIDKLLEGCVQARREVVSSLWPEPGQGLGLRHALQTLCDETARQARLPVRFDGDGAAAMDTLPDAIAQALLRVTQAALMNSVEHAQARAIWVNLRLAPGSVSLQVRDNGSGMAHAPQDRRSRGLASMRSRVLELGGHWSIDSAPGYGTTVHARLPW